MLYTGIQRVTDNFLDECEGTLNVRPAMDKFACDVIAKEVFCLDDATGFVETTHKVYSTKGISGKKYKFSYLLCLLFIHNYLFRGLGNIFFQYFLYIVQPVKELPTMGFQPTSFPFLEVFSPTELHVPATNRETRPSFFLNSNTSIIRLNV